MDVIGGATPPLSTASTAETNFPWAIVIPIVVVLIVIAVIVTWAIMTSKRVKQEKDPNDVSAKEPVADSSGIGSERNVSPPPQSPETPPPQKNRHPFLMFILIALAIVGIVGIVFACAYAFSNRGGNSSENGGGTTQTPQLFTREARDSDVSISLNDKFSLSMDYTLTADVDITGLEVTFTFADSDYVVLTTVTKYVGNVEAGTKYNITVSLTDFSVWDIFKISYSRSSVTGGRVSYFA